MSKTFRYSLALFVVTGISLALERPWYDLLTQEFDRLSIVHFSIFFLIALLWIILSIFNRYTLLFRERINRFLSVLLCGAILILAVFLFFPKFYRGPLADFDPRYLSIWFNTIYEVQPLLSRAAPLSMSIQLIGSVIISLAFLLYLLLWSARDDKWRGWFFILFLIFVFTLLSFCQIRWTIYAQTAAVIPMAELMNRVLARRRRQESEVLKTFRNVFIKLVFSGGLFLFAGALVKNIFAADVKSYHRAHIIPLCEYLNQTEEWRGGELCILTHIDFGAEILYRTKHKVIATLCNRYGQGTADTFDIMMAGTDERALELLQKRKVDLILLWPESAEATYYVGTQQTSTFYQRLYKNMIPHWLRKVDLPPNLYSSFLLFRITQN